MTTKSVKVGIMPYEQYKQYTIAIAKGQRKPERRAPKIWFNSMKSFANILSEDNQTLLKLIVEQQPQSVKELEDLTGRKSNNLLRTLRALEKYGFIKLIIGKSKKGRPPLIPKVIFETAKLELNFV